MIIIIIIQIIIIIIHQNEELILFELKNSLQIHCVIHIIN
ncbi:unnamed protein product, partial [Schistosoma curassoni]|uniref:Uncharacterized protein n=1 Tax=Schistosoma curassoni TaxID=6186 RepID=A0A183KV69_9TREM